MFALTMRFTLPENTDWETIPAMMEDRARNLYADMPGLVSKAFVYDPDSREYGGNYVWETRGQLDGFLASDLVRQAKEKFGEPTTVRIHAVAVLLHRGEVLTPSGVEVVR
ncbi:MAG TPA: hypothetical protein VGR61_11520 [Candidatus Dormibacteraeota bacterium]|nr:hypothetical protein [Candidatus Dormibacteraeota bacterium]